MNRARAVLHLQVGGGGTSRRAGGGGCEGAREHVRWCHVRACDRGRVRERTLEPGWAGACLMTRGSRGNTGTSENTGPGKWARVHGDIKNGCGRSRIVMACLKFDEF